MTGKSGTPCAGTLPSTGENDIAHSWPAQLSRPRSALPVISGSQSAHPTPSILTLSGLHINSLSCNLYSQPRNSLTTLLISCLSFLKHRIISFSPSCSFFLPPSPSLFFHRTKQCSTLWGCLTFWILIQSWVGSLVTANWKIHNYPLSDVFQRLVDWTGVIRAEPRGWGSHQLWKLYPEEQEAFK